MGLGQIEQDTDADDMMHDTTDTIDRAPATEPSAPLRDALLQSRQRWRDLLSMATDLAFETDAWGRLTFVMPDGALGWPQRLLLGQPAELLLASPADMLNPFRPTVAYRDRRAWFKRANGSLACMRVAAAPLFDAEGNIIGSRGVGVDMSDQDSRDGSVAGALRRGEVIEHMLRRIRNEVLAPRMMQAALHALMAALGAEGAAVLDIDRALEAELPAAIAHQVGGGAAAILPTAAGLLDEGMPQAARAQALDGRPVLVSACPTRFARRMGLAIWRTPGSREWDGEDHMLIASAATITRVILDHEDIQLEMGRQARTDPLTGLYNRRAFLDELARHVDRLDRDGNPGTLLFADLDNFKPLNDRYGHDIGDSALRETARLLRDLVRPTDLIARLGGDEFAIFLHGADELTAAERGEWLRVEAPRALARALEIDDLDLTMSIGIACRVSGGGEHVDALIRRADQAMYTAKRSGRAHWRVAAPAEVA